MSSPQRRARRRRMPSVGVSMTSVRASRGQQRLERDVPARSRRVADDPLAPARCARARRSRFPPPLAVTRRSAPCWSSSRPRSARACRSCRWGDDDGTTRPGSRPLRCICTRRSTGGGEKPLTFVRRSPDRGETARVRPRGHTCITSRGAPRRDVERSEEARKSPRPSAVVAPEPRRAAPVASASGARSRRACRVVAGQERRVLIHLRPQSSP